MACMGRTSRSRRPCARGEVLCTEPGKSHPCPDRQAGPVHEGNSRTMNMHADENSDGVIVPEKRPNKEALPSAEAVEGRTPPKGNGDETAAARTLRRDNASNGLIPVRQAARQSKSVRFTALLHHIAVELLKRSYLSLERDSAPGIDGVTWQSYGENLEEKLEDLHDKVHRGSYRARPARRTYIPKADGSKRPLSILCLEDKIVQQAVATVSTGSANWKSSHHQSFQRLTSPSACASWSTCTIPRPPDHFAKFSSTRVGNQPDLEPAWQNVYNFDRSEEHTSELQ